MDHLMKSLPHRRWQPHRHPPRCLHCPHHYHPPSHYHRHYWHPLCRSLRCISIDEKPIYSCIRPIYTKCCRCSHTYCCTRPTQRKLSSDLTNCPVLNCVLKMYSCDRTEIGPEPDQNRTRIGLESDASHANRTRRCVKQREKLLTRLKLMIAVSKLLRW